MQHDAGAAFLDRLIDDAGMFPPARFGLGDALAAHAAALAGPYPAIVGRFVVAAATVPLLVDALTRGDSLSLAEAAGPLEITVTLDGAAARPEALRALGAVVRQAAPVVRLRALEVPLAALAGDTDDDRIAAITRAIGDAAFAERPDAYLEVAFAAQPDATLDAIARARETRVNLFGKMRCGGLGASAIPSEREVAAFVWQAARLGVPFKATAGLHHPIRYHDAALGAPAHGFLNVIGAAVLAHARGSDQATLAAMIADREPSNFELNRQRFAWNGIGADAVEIARARGEFVHGYGSCSLTEPVHDLAALRLLPRRSVPA